jgi:hypothetical protein
MGLGTKNHCAGKGKQQFRVLPLTHENIIKKTNFGEWGIILQRQ